ncbi:MAG: HAD family hydrolase [Desulfobacterales bacterium]|jgi:HAD superfamily hydrolase (TIGR01509 family)
MNRIHTIICDFDGTLADTQGAIKHAFINTLQNMGISVPLDAFMNEIYSQTVEEMFREAGVLNNSLLKEAVSHYCRLYGVIGPQKATLFPGVLQTLKRLRERNVSLAIATNENRKNLERLLPTLKICHFFSVTICEDEVSHPKPHPEMVYKILDKTGSSPDQTLIVGDSAFDILMGKTTNCNTCAVTYGTHSEAKLRSYSPDWLIDHFNNVLEIIEVVKVRTPWVAGIVRETLQNNNKFYI